MPTVPKSCTRRMRMPAGIPSSQSPKAKNQRRTQILHCSSNFPAAPINAATLCITLNSSLYHCIQYTGGITQASTFSSQHRGPTTTIFSPKSPRRWVPADSTASKGNCSFLQPPRPARGSKQRRLLPPAWCIAFASPSSLEPPGPRMPSFILCLWA